MNLSNFTFLKKQIMTIIFLKKEIIKMHKTIKKYLLSLIILFPNCAIAHEAMTESKIILMRHAAGEHTEQKIFNADPGHPLQFHLTEVGKQEAIEAAQKMLDQGINSYTVKKVYVSPMLRTIETAEILAEKGVFDKSIIEIEPRLIEIGMGEREGHYFREYSEHPWDHSDADIKYGGETYDQVQSRVVNLYKDIQKWDAGASEKGYVLFVSHGTPSKMLVDAVQGHAEKILSTAEFKPLSIKECHKCAMIK